MWFIEPESLNKIEFILTCVKFHIAENNLVSFPDAFTAKDLSVFH